MPCGNDVNPCPPDITVLVVDLLLLCFLSLVVDVS